MRRNVGLSSLSQQSAHLESYSSLSSDLSQQQLSTLQSQLSTFQSALRTFANKHRAKILSDPVFRTHFADMCNQLGVDPLGSGGRKGVWDFLGVGEWTYALAVQIVDVCLQTRDRNGGLLEMDEVIRGVTRLRSGSSVGTSKAFTNNIINNSTTTTTSNNSKQQSKKQDKTAPVTTSDVVRAIDALKPLGCGYSIIQVGDKKMVRSVAAEFDTDSLTILECTSEGGKGCTSVSELRRWTASRPLGGGGGAWTFRRAETAVQRALMDDGLLWLDEGVEGETLYWMPSLFDFQEEEEADARLPT